MAAGEKTSVLKPVKGGFVILYLWIFCFIMCELKVLLQLYQNDKKQNINKRYG